VDFLVHARLRLEYQAALDIDEALGSVYENPAFRDEGAVLVVDFSMLEEAGAADGRLQAEPPGLANDERNPGVCMGAEK
jgi:hypothetical protein